MSVRIVEWLPELIIAFKVTLTASIIGIFTSLCWGCVVSCVTAFEIKAVNIFSRIYISVFRNTPLLVIIFFCFYGLPYVGVYMPAMVCAIVSITLNEGAFVAEIIRGSIENVPKGEVEAAHSLGLSKFDIVTKVVFPLAFRTSIPMLTGQASIVIKDTSLLSMIMVVEITRCGNLFYSRYFDSVSFWIVGALYIICFLVFSYAGKILENRVMDRR